MKPDAKENSIYKIIYKIIYKLIYKNLWSINKNENTQDKNIQFFVDLYRIYRKAANFSDILPIQNLNDLLVKEFFEKKLKT